MDVVPSVKSNAESSKLVKPTHSSLRDPAIDTQATAVFGVALSQKRFDAAFAEFHAHTGENSHGKLQKIVVNCRADS